MSETKPRAVEAVTGWRHERDTTSSTLPGFRSIAVPHGAGLWRKIFAFGGPGLMVAVGYMDPGNWATDLAGGAQFGYMLLTAILISNFMAILLQHLSLKLGIVTGRDLAQACRDHYSRPVALGLWVLCEIAIIACDLAEVIGSAVALNLLFGLPLILGILITAFDVFFILLLQDRGVRLLELLVTVLILVIGGCFAYELWLAKPVWADVLVGLFPSPEVVMNPSALYIAIGILGATVMPHNLYLHSGIVQTRAYDTSSAGKSTAIKFATIDSTAALLCAFFINAAILILSAAAFHGTENSGVADINDAFRLLAPSLGTAAASTLFAVALLCSGQNSTITGTMAGQIVMEGFLHLRIRPWVRRVITRLLAIIPAVVVAIVYGEGRVGGLLVLSQVILSLQLSFAVVPLVIFTSDRKKMGEFVNSIWLTAVSALVTVVIIVLNIYLLVQTAIGA